MNQNDLEIKISKPDPLTTNKYKRFTYHRKISLTVKRHINHPLLKEFLAETFGTCLMILVGLSGGAQARFVGRDNSYLADNLSPNILAGLSLTISILVVGKVSKAHLNPAVSLAILLNKQMTISEFLFYIAAQFIGSFFGAVLVFLFYLDILNSYKENKYSIDTATIFVTMPNKNLSMVSIIFDQIAGTAVYLILILSLTDKKNVKFSYEGTALIVGMALFIVCSTLSYNTGSPLNPARDFSPRIFISIAGWGSEVFSYRNFYFWIPIVCPMIGSAIGTSIYWLVISRNLN